MRLAVSFAIALALLSPLAAQDFFDHGQLPRINGIDRYDGLPNNSVSAIVQDRFGYLWFGTQGGLARYNGRRFETFRNIPFDDTSLPHDLVQTAYYDAENDALWIGTYHGLARVGIQSDTFELYSHDPENPRSLSNDVVIAVSRGPDGALWVGTQDGLNRLRDDGSFDRIETQGPVIRALFLDRSGTLWIGGYDGLGRWNTVNKRVEPVDIALPSQFVMAIDQRRDGAIVLGIWDGGLVEFSVESLEVTTTTLSDNKIYTVLVGSDETIWAGTWGGGLFARTVDGQVFSFAEGDDAAIESPIVYSLFEDSAGLVWVGTNGGGLHYLSPRKQNYRVHYNDPGNPDSLPHGKVNEIFRDSQGRLWAGLYGGGLARYEQGRWIAWRHDEADPYSLANDIVTVIYEDMFGHIWVAGNGGLQRVEDDGRFLDWNRDLYPDAPILGEIVYALLEDRGGDFWIGTYRNGISRFNPETGTIRDYRSRPGDPTSLANDLVYGIYEDSFGAIWIATNGGLSLYQPDSDDFTSYVYRSDDQTGLASNTVRTVFEDSQRRLWLGTSSGGLNRFERDTGRFTRLTTEDGLSNNSVVGILEDDIGRLWVATQQGLSVYDPDTGAIEILDERDGLYGSEFNTGHLRDRDGSLYFGGSHGITRFDTSEIARNTHPPRVHISDVTVYQESIDPGRATFNGDRIELSATDDFLGFEFVALEYESPESNQFAYQLIGFDRDWVYAGTRDYATYTSLAPGEYQLAVLAANGDGYWTTEPVTLDIVVAAPWYGRWWAYAAYIVVALLVLGTAWRLRENKVLAAKNRALEFANAQLGRANQELERLSIRDALTGVFNRRYFDTRILEEWSRARRAAVPLALLMIDIDHFKSYNDAFGHVTGDRLLIEVARTMDEALTRAGDFVARYGGEEFAVLLFDTEEEGAVAVAERLRNAVATIEPIGNGDRQTTVSIGVAVRVPRQGVKTAELIHESDAALYRAKRSGRNCVVSAIG